MRVGYSTISIPSLLDPKNTPTFIILTNLNIFIYYRVGSGKTTGPPMPIRRGPLGEVMQPVLERAG